jgi:hypothetical protein
MPPVHRLASRSIGSETAFPDSRPITWQKLVFNPAIFPFSHPAVLPPGIFLPKIWMFTSHPLKKSIPVN